jgi:hypothetical protein
LFIKIKSQLKRLNPSDKIECFRKKLVNLKSGTQKMKDDEYVVKFISRKNKKEVCRRRRWVFKGFKKYKKIVKGLIEIKSFKGVFFSFQIF